MWCEFWSLCPQLGEDPLGAAGGVLARLVGHVGRSRRHHPAGSSLQRPSRHQLVERRPTVPDRKHPGLHRHPQPEGWECEFIKDKCHLYICVQHSSYVTSLRTIHAEFSFSICLLQPFRKAQHVPEVFCLYQPDTSLDSKAAFIIRNISNIRRKNWSRTFLLF